jgi:Rrf2 family protein
MKLITRDTDYALRAVCFIAKQKGRIVPVSQLVKELKVPQPFLRKLLQILSKKGFLCSQKGMGGGFRLSRTAEEISLLDLLAAFQGPLQLNECVLKKRRCPQIEKCPLKKKISSLEKYVIRQLSPVTVGSLIKEK